MKWMWKTMIIREIYVAILHIKKYVSVYKTFFYALINSINILYIAAVVLFKKKLSISMHIK